MENSSNQIEIELVKSYLEMYIIELYSFSQTFFNTEDFNNIFNTIEVDFDEFKKYLKINYSIENEIARFDFKENNNIVSIERNRQLHQKNLDERLESFQEFFEVESIESFTIDHYRVFIKKSKIVLIA